jgi:tetratricopeptide (TPR) repeat protein
MRRPSLRALAVAGVLAALTSTASAQAPPISDRMLVMPFENETRDARAFWLGEAAALVLADELNALGAVAIEREERREAFARLQVPPAAALTDATVIRVAELVGATDVVVGTFRLADNQLYLVARRLEIEAGRLRKRASEHGPLSELFTVLERLALTLRPAKAEAGAAARERRRPVLGAFESYVKGLLADVPSTAVSYLRAALAAQPTFERARLALWEVYTEQGEHKRAADEAGRIPPESPRRARARFLLGLSQLQLGLSNEAFETFSALSAAEATASALNNLGVAQLRRAPGAVYYFNEAVKADPSDPDLCFNLGYAYLLQQDTTAAVYWLREAVRRKPADGEAHYLLAHALSSAGQSTEAVRERELARRLSSAFDEQDTRSTASDVPRGLERIKTGFSRPHGSRVDATLLDQRNQRELASFYLERGRRLYEQEQDREAVSELSRALFLAPYQAEAHLLIGRIHLRAGRFAEALDAFKIAIWSEETPAAHAALATAHLEMRNFEAAQLEARRALAMDPSLAEASVVLERAERGDRELPRAC